MYMPYLGLSDERTIPSTETPLPMISQTTTLTSSFFASDRWQSAASLTFVGSAVLGLQQVSQQSSEQHLPSSA
jgi:hypothetical protein